MKLTLAEPKYLKDSIAIISEIVTEGKFKISGEAVELVAMDPANVMMVIFKLLSSSFVDYEVPAPMEMSVNLTNFKQILARAKPNDMVVLETDKANANLIITFKGSSTKTFSLPIIESVEREQKVPQLTFPVRIKTSSAVLNDSIDDVDIVGESVSFMADKGKFIVHAEGDLAKAKIEMADGEETSFETGAKESVKSKYSIEYLKKIVKGSKLAANAIIQFNKDYPLRIEYNAVDRAMLAFILAPRVDND